MTKTSMIQNKSFGQELLIDLYNCEASLVNNLDFNYKVLDELVDILKMQKQAPPFLFYSPVEFPDKAGLSGWVPLIESGIQLHTLTAKNFVSIDIYTCGNLVINDVLSYLKKKYQAREVEHKFFLRGEKYYE